ncbi:MAG: dephospho-CoA kinase [Dehalococcoidia bacterium]|nr:dephospho-CoA kinase [Dehalococcoidia bacterium]
MFVIGLTGGIGTGKSEVSRLLNELGAEIIEADKVAHEAYEPGTPGWREVVEAFGEGVLDADGRIDRKALGGIVFGDEEARERLNAIVHPIVRRLLEERIAELERQGTSVAVIEVPLLVEAIKQQSRWTQMLDEIWVVTTPEEQAVARVRARSGLDESAIRARIGSQATEEERAEFADAVIDNGGSLEGLRREVTNLWRERAPHN